MMLLRTRARLLHQSSRNSFLSHRASTLATHERGRNVNKFTERSHNCGELSAKDIGKRVNLFGWVKHSRFDNKIVHIRDSYGDIQCVADKSRVESYRTTPIHNESVVRVSGLVQARPEKQINKKLKTGSIEVLIDELEIINNASKHIPMLTRENEAEHTIENKLRFRYLDIRGKKMQDALRFRSEVCAILRGIMLELDFIECETPTLFRRTPGGANEFIVPTQFPDMFYGLTQSPQQLKQMLMIGGLDRYFQICRCYRDESGRIDRQPEFTQLDIEWSFTNQSMVIAMINELMFKLLSNLSEIGLLNVHLNEIFDDNGQIERIDHREAFLRYGCDKPDTRFGWLIDKSEDGEELSFEVPFSIDLDMLTRNLQIIHTDKKIDTSKYVVDIEHMVPNKTKVLIKSSSDRARKTLGHLRSLLASELNQRGNLVYKGKFKFIWITGFPLFEYDETTRVFEPSHHPFTAPTDDTIHLLDSDPAKVVGQHYDLVLNGHEIAGGSIRIHDADLQRYIFENILKLGDHTFNYFIDALKAGCPPHGGIALGLERLVALLLERDSIKDVIAFPKSNVGRDLMSGCPHAIDPAVKKMYHISNN